SYGELVGGKRFDVTVNAHAPRKAVADWKVMGMPVPRVDMTEMATGTFEFVHNVRVPGMLHGRVVRPASVGAAVASVDEASVRGMPGLVKVVVRKNFVGVVCEKQWQAIQAAAKLKVVWTAGPGLPAQHDFYDHLRKQPARDAAVVDSKDVDQKMTAASSVLKATYLHPYQMHGSMGTSCAVADVKGSGADATATVWSATQGIYPIRDSVALILGLPQNKVRAIYVEGSGCYGINAADTVTYDAAILSQAVGRPVRVQLSRREEMTAGENFGPAYVVDLRAALDNQDRIVSWDYEALTLTKGNRPNATTPGNIITGALAGFATPGFTPAAATRPTNFGNNGNSASSYGS